MYKKYRPEMDDPIYKDWRQKVYRRDKGQCQMPNCSRKGKGMQAHHIRRWADASSLRYEVDNGILLCWNCHKEVTGKELYYEGLFNKIVASKR